MSREVCEHGKSTEAYCPECYKKYGLKVSYAILESQNKELKAEIERLKKDIHDLTWNLAGCDTYALGYGDLHEPPSKDLTRPALISVMNMAIRQKSLFEALKKYGRHQGCSNYPRQPIGTPQFECVCGLDQALLNVKGCSNATHHIHCDCQSLSEKADS